MLAEAAARRLLQRVGGSAPPTDPFAIAERLGIVVQGSANLKGSFSGCLMREGETFGILYSTAIPSPGFRRFTVGHELGHHQCRRHWSDLFAGGRTHHSTSNFTSPSWHEIEADHFSAELLMPEEEFREELTRHPIGVSAIKALAEIFMTSWTSTAIRYAKVTPDPVAVVVCERDRILYCFRSDCLGRVPGTEIRSGDRIPPGSLTREFAADPANVSRAREASDRTPLTYWCPSAASDSMMTEDVLGLGSYGKTLTVLHTDYISAD